MSPAGAEPDAEPFGIAALRASVLRSWRDSPTRLIEDANAERDLRLGAYRDRLLVELAQNAADAATAAGEQGQLRVSCADGELRFANTGAPLDAAGIAGLASLRASPKGDDTVGRFGVGFAAVLAVTDEPRVVSTDGGVAFSARRTRACLEGEVAAADDVAVLRMPWPLEQDEPALPSGFDTEVRLPSRGDVDIRAVLDDIAEQVPDVLLALPALDRVEVEGRVWSRSAGEDGVVELHRPDGSVRRWLTHANAAAGCVWALPVDDSGAPRPLETDLLHTPTPTDERLSLPARLIASLPVEPSRRRVREGDELRAALEKAARAYVGLALRVPAHHLLALVPEPAFPRSDVDATLRGLVGEYLADESWLPTSDGQRVSAPAARVLAAAAPRLVELLTGAVPGLLAAPLCGAEASRLLGSLGVRRLSVGDAVDGLAGLARPRGWWGECYDVLLELLDGREVAPDELGGLPVPLADGRTLPGPRDALVPEVSPEALAAVADADVVGLRVLHPDAAHPLLRRLGTRQAGAGELLAEPAMLDAVRRSVDDARAGLETTALAHAVLRLIAEGGTAEGVGALALPARAGTRRADELVLPDAELLELLDTDVLGADGPLDVVDASFAARTDREVLTRTGLLDGFAVVEDTEPVEPDHDLPDEQQWWAELERMPERLLAVRDLDLVADDAWPATLRLLAAHPESWRALTEPGGHTGWWVARNALLAGRIPLDWRMPEAVQLAGLYDPLPDVGLGDGVARAAGVRTALPALAGGASEDAVSDAADLLERLADPARRVPATRARRVHAALVAMGTDPERLPAPGRVRTLEGSVTDAARAVVLDAPWLLAVWPADRLVAAVDWQEAERLAVVLDLPLASELITADVSSDGDYVPWDELPAVREVAESLELDLPGHGWPGVVLHERLTVTVDGTGHDVGWWVEARLHAQDSPEALARAIAWTSERWSDRHMIAALLDDPDPATLLG